MFLLLSCIKLVYDEYTVTNPVCSIKGCDKKECWLCLGCHKLFCGRYANKHMNIHYESSDNKSHCVALGVGDLSFWCYECDSYLNHLTIQPIFEVYEIAHMAKFGESIPQQVLKETNFLDLNVNQEDDEKKQNDDDKGTKKKGMITKSKKKKKKSKKSKDDDGDQEMDDYESFMNDKGYDKRVDYLDHSVDDEAFDHLMKDVMENKDNPSTFTLLLAQRDG